MPRKSTKDKLIDYKYFEGCCRLIDLDTSDESEAEELEIDVLFDVEVV